MSTGSDPGEISKRGDIAVAVAAMIYRAYRRFQEDFNGLTRRAKVRFESRDWVGMQDDAVERLQLIGQRDLTASSDVQCDRRELVARLELCCHGLHGLPTLRCGLIGRMLSMLRSIGLHKTFSTP